MSKDPVIVEVKVRAPVQAVWDAYTSPEHVVNWNFASEDWHCPSAACDLRTGGRFVSRMEARDGSSGFDFEGVYTKVERNVRIEYEFGGRTATVDFVPLNDLTLLRVAFEPEEEFPREIQYAGWQSILNNFARYISRMYVLAA